MSLSRNKVTLSGRVEWMADAVRHVEFDGGTEDYLRVRISSRRKGKKDTDKATYDSIYVELVGKDAIFAKSNLSVGQFIAVTGTCHVNSYTKDRNGTAMKEESYVVKVDKNGLTTDEKLYLNENEIKIMGQLMYDLAISPGDVERAVMFVKVDRPYGNGRDIFKVKTFGAQAEYVKKWAKKGSFIAVTGKMQPSYFSNGNWRNKAEILAENVENPTPVFRQTNVPTQEQDLIQEQDSIQSQNPVQTRVPASRNAEPVKLVASIAENEAESDSLSNVDLSFLSSLNLNLEEDPF